MTRIRNHSIRKSVVLSLLSFMVAFGTTAIAEPTEIRLNASDGALGDRFGISVATSGTYGIIGAQADDDNYSNAGSAYVYDLTTATQLHKLHASDPGSSDFFGCAVAAHGELAVIGALRDDDTEEDSGSAYILNFVTGTELHKLNASDAGEDYWFGNAVAISTSYALVGSYKADYSASLYDSGAAYLYDTVTGDELHKLIASDYGRQDQFGYAVAVSETYAAAGAPMWDEIGVSDCGAVYVYDVVTGEELWKLTASDLAPYDRFGNALAIDGNHLLVGAYWDANDGGDDAGAVYLFDLATGEELTKLTASDGASGDWFGTSVSLDGNVALIGACQQGYYPEEKGAAYVFDVSTGEELLKLTASDGANDDYYGGSVALSGSYGLIGSDSDDAAGTNSGSAYLYEPVVEVQAVRAVLPSPADLALSNYPNPFNPRTEIRFRLLSNADVSVRILDARGRHVRTLASGIHRAIGDASLTWDGADDQGRPMTSGVYYCEVVVGGNRTTRKLNLLK